MSYDLFVSYARRDNALDSITQFVERISRDFESFAGRLLRPFFDGTEIHGIEDWWHHMLQGLRESRLLLACLSPSYLLSEYCEFQYTMATSHAHPHLQDAIGASTARQQQIGRRPQELLAQLNSVAHPFGIQLGGGNQD